MVATSVACAADAAIYTLVEGDARVLRGTTWLKLVPGGGVEGDIVEAEEHANVQLELSGGAAIDMHGPAALFAARQRCRRALVRRAHWTRH
ncbi:MAG TPA: hypothetical protein VLI21_04865 [Casimicrobiaceae bacterium]|nr:hypothetical protein [Casimicrobiaceae bacterium]